MNNRQTAVDIFLSGVERVKPDNLIRSTVSVSKSELFIKDLSFDLLHVRNIYVIGAGKASALMALEIENILGDLITEGHIITKYDHAVPLKYIGLTEAGHPVPDENSVKGTEKIKSLIRKAAENDLVICLISGGGSALMTDVPLGCSLEDIKAANDLLLKSGATINEMNCIRKHLSGIKGGKLSAAAWPAEIVSLILSDVVGDPLDVIASGPTAPDPSSFADAINILKKFKLEDKISAGINDMLQSGAAGKLQETLKSGDPLFSRTHNLVIGSNRLALEQAAAKAVSLGYDTRIITSTLEGDVIELSRYIVETSGNAAINNQHIKSCLLFGGEPTIKVQSGGRGGRNQHLALCVSLLLKEEDNITILSAGTDGTDGPTDAAGAVVDYNTCKNAANMGLDIQEYLKKFDSYNFFLKEGGLIITGPTQTNVMDIIVVLIHPEVLHHQI